MTPLQFNRLRVERLATVSLEALGPPQDPELALRGSRKAALENVGLSKAFGWDAFDNSVWPGPKFMFSAPLLPPLDPHEPDQQADMFDESDEFDPLPPDRPATRAHYFNVMRAETGQR